MARKPRKVEIKGFLGAEDVTKWPKDDKEFHQYWNKIKNNLYLVMDTVDPNNKGVKFLNREFKSIAKKFEGHYVKITVEAMPTPKAAMGIRDTTGMPDMDDEYEGFEEFKRTMFSLFKIS